MELPYILRNGNSEKIPSISGKGTFLYFMNNFPSTKSKKNPL